MGKIEEIENKIFNLKEEKEDLYNKITKLEGDFLNRIPEEFLGDIGHIFNNQNGDSLAGFIWDTFKANYPDNKKSIKIIEEKFNEVYLKLKSDLNLIENVQKGLF